MNYRGPVSTIWNPEYAAYMVEGTPALPYGTTGHLITSLCEIEDNMRFRRLEVLKLLGPDETIMSITNFPRLGCPNFTYPVFNPKPETGASGSVFLPDEVIFNGHPRFRTLTKNIRSRARRKQVINLPVFQDTNTRMPFIECFKDAEAKVASKPNHVYMDACGFGMGCCCLQVTFQATHLEEAKVLYDQLAPLAPIALALSAASPVYRGILTDRDCRWDVISRAMDDRTREELGITKELKESKHRIPKSRYDSISAYLTKQGQKYNDIELVYDKNYHDIMIANKVEPGIARHIAHLFIRDPLALYREKLNQTDQELDHFENIQSTNWQTMRLKPPPTVNSSIGWRVEFRPIEAQTSDFESAAYVVFITLLTRVILAYKLNFLMPISLVDENMVTAQKRDSVKDGKFWFRREIMHKSSSNKPLNTVLENTVCENSNNSSDNTMNQSGVMFASPIDHGVLIRRTAAIKAGQDNSVVQMTVNEIINGSDEFIGIMPIICHYVDSFDDGSNTQMLNRIKSYLKLISDRASLKTKTTARVMRDFIDAHPKYCHDSIVNEEVNYDLLKFMDKIGKSEIVCSELTGDAQTCPLTYSRHQQRQQYGRSETMSNGHHQTLSQHSNNNGLNHHHRHHLNGAINRKSSTPFGGINSSSRKSPSGRMMKQQHGTDNTHNNRSMSR